MYFFYCNFDIFILHIIGTGNTNNNLSSTLPPPPLSGQQPQRAPKIPQYVGNNLNECNMNCPCNTWNKCPEHHMMHTTTNQKAAYKDHIKLPSLIKDSEESLQQLQQGHQGHFWDTGSGHLCSVGEDSRMTISFEGKDTPMVTGNSNSNNNNCGNKATVNVVKDGQKNSHAPPAPPPPPQGGILKPKPQDSNTGDLMTSSPPPLLPWSPPCQVGPIETIVR